MKSFLFQLPVVLFSAIQLLTPATAQDGAAPSKPAETQTYWDREPVVELGSKRGEIVLNGPWNFMPAAGEARAASPAAWGSIWVPGAWKGPSRLPGLINKGQGAAWEKYDGNTLARAWYRRTLRIPAAWKARAILLDFDRVSTDAVITVNGRNCGRVRWPSGTVDISEAVQAGNDAELVVDVASAPEEKDADALLASSTATPQLRPDGDGKWLESRGITGDVVMTSRPRGAHVDDVFVQPSVRKRELGLLITLAERPAAGPVSFVASLENEKGVEEKRFEQQITVPAGDFPQVRLAWPWTNPRLWDEAQPNLYTLKLRATGPGIDDEYVQKFGFRELWIEGRKLLLNGTEFRMRPTSDLAAGEYAEVGANRLAIANRIDASRRFGINIQEIWPSQQPRGMYQAWSTWYDVADGKGWPMIGVGLGAVPYFHSNASEWAARKDDYRRDAEKYMRRIRNHPSVVMWGLDGNNYSHSSDQSPLNIGRRGYHDKEPWYQGSIAPGLESIQINKQLDPTRPVITHHGSYVGDMHTANNYLCLTPLQEREEWLSAWAKNGEMPYSAIEFGMPLFNTFLRARTEYPASINSEPWITEFQTTYLGNDAYKLESDAYRKEVRSNYDSSHAWGDQHYHQEWYSSSNAKHAPGLEELYSLFITNTWRSWRTMGISGGMVPWDLANTFSQTAAPPVALPPFQPGTRGTYKASLNAPDYYGYGDERGGYKPLPAAIALMRNNGPTLAWIAGAPEAFTSKDHHFAAGEPVRKQVVLLNDTRQTQVYSYLWKAIVKGKVVASGRNTGRIETGKTVFQPLTFIAPNSTSAKVDGTLTLEAKIGTSVHTDAFPFRVYKPAKPRQIAVAVFDPSGSTTRMLKALGFTTKNWTGGRASGLVVIGRDALSGVTGAGRPALPASLEAFVQNGGKAIVMEQDPDWFRDRLGLRIARPVARRAFPVDSASAFKGWDAEDLRDWNGSSTVLPDHFESPKESAGGWPQYPRWGWHWGNRHGVSSAAIEKPHLAGWRPLLECEFDLAYSPLMELDYGKGRLTLCTLDVEDHAAQDPAAAWTARRALEYAARPTVAATTRKTVYLGGDAASHDSRNEIGPLDALGLKYQKAAQLDPQASLTIIGAGAKVDENALNAYLRTGGKALFLPAQSAVPRLGVTAGQVKNFGGSLAVPAWPEAAGLSPSDLRWRSFKDAWTIQSGAEVGAGGLLARKAVGKGVAIFCQLNPAELEADKYTYLRFTRWRETRALAQVLANMGATFAADGAVFRMASPKTISLTGAWRARITQKLDGNTEAKDAGISEEARQLATSTLDDAGWQQAAVPADWGTYGDDWAKMNGEAVFRKVVDIPADWAGHDLQLDLGAIEDFDNTFFNGVEIGASGNKLPTWQLNKRYYVVPGKLVKAGRNVLAVRVWDTAGSGGLRGAEGSGPMKSGPEQMQLTVNLFYHPDYRRDFVLGDDPYRYYRW